MDVRLAGGNTNTEGRVEIRLDDGHWGVSCAHGWGVREAIVTCRHLGLQYAAAALETRMYGGESKSRINTTERSLLEKSDSCTLLLESCIISSYFKLTISDCSDTSILYTLWPT